MKNIKIIGVIDSVKERQSNYRRTDTGMDVLWSAQNAHDRMESYRNMVDRCFRYQNGDQWSDKIEVSPGEWMTEGEWLRREGEVPITNNLINRLVNTYVGVYRSQLKEPTCVARDREEQSMGEVMSTVLQCNHQRNQMSRINAKTFKNYLITAAAIYHKGYKVRDFGSDVYTDFVDPHSFFIDGISRDLRGWDASMMGMIHDDSWQSVCHEFCKTKAEEEELWEEYSACRSKSFMQGWYSQFGRSEKNYSFFTPNDPSVCRWFEIWTREIKSRFNCHDFLDGSEFKVESEDYAEVVQRENEERVRIAIEAGLDEKVAKEILKVVEDEARGGERGAYAEMYAEGLIPDELMLITAFPFADSYWYYYFLTPTGKILKEGENPYKHGRPPFVFTFSDFLNGEVHSFVENIIPENHYYNQLLTQKNMILRASAKGVLAIGKRAAKGRSEKYFADRWSKPRATFIYDDTEGGTVPTQINSAVNTSAIDTMIMKQEQNLEVGSGIHGALQGRGGSTATSGTHYALQAQNSTMTMLDCLDSFNEFLEDAALMDVQLIQQYYTDKQYFDIVGKSADAVWFDPQKIRNVQFDLAIGESTSTPAYRQLAQDTYNQMYRDGVITADEFLEFGDVPNGDAIIQSRRARQEEEAKMQAQAAQMQQQQAPAQQRGGSGGIASITTIPNAENPNTSSHDVLSQFKYPRKS